MAAYNGGEGSVAPSSITALPAVAATVKPALMAAVGNMVDLMKQFDANGNKLGTAGTPVASTAESLSKSLTQPASTGYLSVGGK